MQIKCKTEYLYTKAINKKHIYISNGYKAKKTHILQSYRVKKLLIYHKIAIKQRHLHIIIIIK